MRQPSCPAELKILVADMLTAYDNYRRDHDLLHQAGTKEEISSLSASVVENYLENRSIWEELAHYKRTGSILGTHRIFDWMKTMQQIRSMRVPDLVNKKTRLENNLIRARLALRREPDHARTNDRKQRIAMMEKELSEVNLMLSIS